MFFDVFQRFWKQHPALLYGFSALIGVYAALEWTFVLLFPVALLAISFKQSVRNEWIRLLLAIILMITSFCFVSVYYQFPSLSPEGVSGMAEIDIYSVSSQKSNFGKRWIYRGTIKSFFSATSELDRTSKFIARNIPYQLSIPHTEEILRPPGNQSYLVYARLKQSSSGHYTLTISKKTPWIPIVNSWSLAEWRLLAKERVGHYIHEHIQHPRSAAFLTGIATGDFDDRLMAFEFGRFGLQHIMAISGFHFAIVAAILSFFFRFLMSQKKTVLILMFLMSSYCVFLGCGSSILRAWLMISVALGGCLLERRSSGLNSLGVACLSVLFIDPLMSRTIGFQFSFVTTATILLFFPIVEQLFQKILIKRSLSQMVEMNLLNQHGYLVLTTFRQALALTVAVNLAALPLMFYYFHKFPVFSLVYNLFFPFLVSISMFLLICAFMITPFIPLLGHVLHAINDIYTRWVLNFTYNMPTSIDVVWRISGLPAECLICYLSLLFCLGVVLKSFLKQQQEAKADLVFL